MHTLNAGLDSVAGQGENAQTDIFYIFGIRVKNIGEADMFFGYSRAQRFEWRHCMVWSNSRHAICWQIVGG